MACTRQVRLLESRIAVYDIFVVFAHKSARLRTPGHYICRGSHRGCFSCASLGRGQRRQVCRETALLQNSCETPKCTAADPVVVWHPERDTSRGKRWCLQAVTGIDAVLICGPGSLARHHRSGECKIGTRAS